MSSRRYSWCLVQNCKNTSIKTPHKLFIRVPNDPKMRSIWLERINRDPKSLSTKSCLYICEDHFDLENDMKNYMEYKLMGSVKYLKMKPNCVPKIEGQPENMSRHESALPDVVKKKITTDQENKCSKNYLKTVWIKETPRSDDTDFSNDDHKAIHLDSLLKVDQATQTEDAEIVTKAVQTSRHLMAMSGMHSIGVQSTVAIMRDSICSPINFCECITTSSYHKRIPILRPATSSFTHTRKRKQCSIVSEDIDCNFDNNYLYTP